MLRDRRDSRREFRREGPSATLPQSSPRVNKPSLRNRVFSTGSFARRADWSFHSRPSSGCLGTSRFVFWHQISGQSFSKWGMRGIDLANRHLLLTTNSLASFSVMIFSGKGSYAARAAFTRWTVETPFPVILAVFRIEWPSRRRRQMLRCFFKNSDSER